MYCKTFDSYSNFYNTYVRNSICIALGTIYIVNTKIQIVTCTIYYSLNKVKNLDSI